jgi:hypothetical protein
VCGASQASRKLLPHRQVVHVECLQCRVYEIEPGLASQFESLRQAAIGRDRWLLERLASNLRYRPAAPMVTLTAANWRAVAEPQTVL